jgi:REP-associated tyrosine transposase
VLRGFWQRRFHDFNVFTEKKTNEKLRYMHWNPVKRKLVREPQHWPWWSFNFYGKKGIVLLEMDPS